MVSSFNFEDQFLILRVIQQNAKTTWRKAFDISHVKNIKYDHRSFPKASVDIISTRLVR